AASGDAAAEGQGLPATGARAQRVNVRPARRQSERWSTVFTVFAAIALAALLLLGAAIVGARQTPSPSASPSPSPSASASPGLTFTPAPRTSVPATEAPSPTPAPSSAPPSATPAPTPPPTPRPTVTPPPTKTP